MKGEYRDREDLQDIALDWSSRFRALTDGVFAIVLTILVLSLNIPQNLETSSHAEVAAILRRVSRDFLSYVVSFAVVGAYWVAHISAFQGRIRMKIPLMFLNLAFLFWVSLIPFSTNIIMQNGGSSYAWYLYCGNLFFVGLFHAFMVARIDYREKIVPEKARARFFAALVGPAVFLLAGGVGYFSLSLAAWVPVLIWPLGVWVHRKANLPRTSLP